MAVTRIPAASDEDDSQDQNPQPPPPPANPPPNPRPHSLSNASTATVDIEAWTVAALESLSIAPIARGTGNALSIPLDGDHKAVGEEVNGNGNGGAPAQMKLRGVAFGNPDPDAYGAGITPPRRPPSRRDSMRKREALLKGKEGSRQRRRWENGKRSAPLLFFLLPS